MTDGRPLIGAAIIVKDEADHLRRCLASIREWCDEIVVVDTGSTDDTVPVAVQHDALVLHRDWDGDFSAARNAALDHVRADWVLYIDADEEVRDTDVTAVRHTLATAERVAGFMVKFASNVGFTPYWEHRLWRHRDDVRFRGRIHESMLPDLRRVVADEAQRFARLDLFIQHYGYEGDQRAKHLRNLPMLLEQVAATPDRVYLWNHLGRVHEGLNNDLEAEAAWRRGIEVVRAKGIVEEVDIMVYGSLALFLLRHGRAADEIIIEGLALDPDYYTLHVAAARQHLSHGRFAEAEQVARGLVALDPDELHHSVLAFSRQLFTRVPWEIIGNCRFEAADYAAAAIAFQRAADFGADALEMRTKIVACRALSGHQQLTAEGLDQ